MEDCFAYRGNSCTALKVKKCEGSFYKTKAIRAGSTKSNGTNPSLMPSEGSIS